MTRPIVYFIGAGPGDPGLITSRGLRHLRRADVVLYDHPVHASLLRQVRSDAELIDVGLAAPHPLDQQAISYLLVEKAREGKVVARLKWGDPFVFDSGAEEAMFLRQQGVAFEVIPGVPAGIGASAYAGIPATFPGTGDTLTLVRGFEDGSRTPPSIDWNALARLKGTIICYAGASQLPGFLQQLIEHGRPADEPAAVVYNGTLATQDTVEGSLGDLVQVLARTKHRGPATLIAGGVAALRPALRWFDARPLFGRRILVTRPEEQAAELVDPLADLGAQVIVAPLIKILPPDDFGPLDEACARVGAFDWVIFTSANAVDAFVGRLFARGGDLRDLKGPRLCTIGPSTAEHLTRFGVRIDLIPAESRAEGVIQALAATGGLAGAQVLLPRADIAREVLAQELRSLGAQVTEVIAYRTVPVEIDQEGQPDIYRMLLDREIDVVTFTSASAVRQFVRAFGTEPAADLLKSTVVACIGPVTADAAARCGITTTLMPSHYTVPALVERIAEHFERSPEANPDAERPSSPERDNS